MWSRGIVGLLLCAVGAMWILQGTNVIHGSGMSGEGKWGVIGVIVALVGLGCISWAAAIRRRGSASST